MQERTDTQEGDTRGERESLPGKPTKKLFQLTFFECGYFQLVERLPREKSNRTEPENHQSIVHGQQP